MPTRLEESLERDIERIRQQVLEMSALAEGSLRDCVRALAEGNRQLAYAVILRDQYIDEKEKAIDRLCLEFLVRQQPVGVHLRLAYSTIKINLELERVGDYAESVARQLLRLSTLPNVPPAIRERVEEMAALAIPMLHDSIEAFVRQDPVVARRVIVVEPAVDALLGKLNGEILDLLRAGRIEPEMVEPLVTIGRRFERVADQARNVCMETIYMCTGEYAKHPGAETFRILFVGEHNACRSQIAEAIANSLNQPKFSFSSAGLDPRALAPRTLAFLREKGLDTSHAAPKAIYQVPNLEYYQVIVGVAKEAQQAFPRTPRKMVYVDWSIEDPSRVQGTPEEVRAAYEATYQFLSNHVRDLVEAVLGARIAPSATGELP
jgi:phosphate transport system protein